MGTFTSYFDAAGTENDSDVIVACGALSYVDDWSAFDELRLATMKRFGVNSFHMKDFAHFKKPYDVGWEGNEPKRREFLSSLVTEINESVSRLYVTTLVLSDYEVVNREYQMAEHMASPYTWAMSNCLFNTFDWVFGKGGEIPDPTCPVLPSDGVIFFVEKGDIGQEGIRKLMLRMGWTDKEFDETIQFVSKTLAGEDVTPFHAPDFVAYEYRSEHRHWVVERKQKIKPRGALKAIRAELFPKVGVVDAKVMQRACELNNIPRR